MKKEKIYQMFPFPGNIIGKEVYAGGFEHNGIKFHLILRSYDLPKIVKSTNGYSEDEHEYPETDNWEKIGFTKHLYDFYPWNDKYPDYRISQAQTNILIKKLIKFQQKEISESNDSYYIEATKGAIKAFENMTRIDNEVMRKDWIEKNKLEISDRGIPIFTLSKKIDALAHCAENTYDGPAWEDCAGHICDLLHHVAQKLDITEEKLMSYYGKNPTPIKDDKKGIA